MTIQPNTDEEPAYYWQDLDEEPNLRDLRDSADAGDLYGIVSEEDGGIIAYANGVDHANLIVDALHRYEP